MQIISTVYERCLNLVMLYYNAHYYTILILMNNKLNIILAHENVILSMD